LCNVHCHLTPSGARESDTPQWSIHLNVRAQRCPSPMFHHGQFWNGYYADSICTTDHLSGHGKRQSPVSHVGDKTLLEQRDLSEQPPATFTPKRTHEGILVPKRRLAPVDRGNSRASVISTAWASSPICGAKLAAVHATENLLKESPFKTDLGCPARSAWISQAMLRAKPASPPLSFGDRSRTPLVHGSHASLWRAGKFTPQCMLPNMD